MSPVRTISDQQILAGIDSLFEQFSTSPCVRANVIPPSTFVVGHLCSDHVQRSLTAVLKSRR